MKKITIAIDGHSSCGKSTMAKDLAREVGYVYVDTGAMYRSVTLYALRNGLFTNEAPRGPLVGHLLTWKDCAVRCPTSIFLSSSILKPAALTLI